MCTPRPSNPAVGRPGRAEAGSLVIFRDEPIVGKAVYIILNGPA